MNDPTAWIPPAVVRDIGGDAEGLASSAAEWIYLILETSLDIHLWPCFECFKNELADPSLGRHELQMERPVIDHL